MHVGRERAGRERVIRSGAEENVILVLGFWWLDVVIWERRNTTEGGPCDMRLASRNAWDAPNPYEEPSKFCLKRAWKAEGPCDINGMSPFEWLEVIFMVFSW